MNVNDVLGLLRKQGTRRTIDEMARYGIDAKRAFGVPMGALLKLKKRWAPTTSCRWPCGRTAGTKRACWPPWWATRSV
jgi:hypothetical protein